jgi:hypothetical protein
MLFMKRVWPTDTGNDGAGVAAPVVQDDRKKRDFKNALAHGAEDQLQGAFRADVLVIQWRQGPDTSSLPRPFQLLTNKPF